MCAKHEGVSARALPMRDVRAKMGVPQKHTCHTISPFFTRWQDSMYDNAYQSEPDEVLPYLQGHSTVKPAHSWGHPSAALLKL